MGIQPEHGAVVKLDSTTGGSLVDYSAWVKSVTPPSIDHRAGTYNVMSSRFDKTLDGGIGATWSMDVYADPAAGSLHRVLEAWQSGGGGLRTYQIDMPDSNTGSGRNTGECRLQSYSPGQGVAGSGNARAGTATFLIDSGDTASTL